MAQQIAGLHVVEKCDGETLCALYGGNGTLVVQEKCLSLFDPSAPFATLEQKALMLSIHIMSPIIFCAATEETFLLGVCIMGFTTLRHSFGDTASHDIAQTHAKSKDFANQLGIEGHVEEIRRLMRERDPMKVLSELSELTGIKLSI